jgi:class 3 adenylate cyclase
MSCGASLVAPAAEERRTVTILFADLVGFTERSDEADPEDVRRTLIPFHGRAKDAIERYGGRLDKFIGDAAMGVFGAPVEHEDDPVRAVRAAMDLVMATEGDHPIRVAVNTGEAVVVMGTGPQIGEAVAGDVVNTTSRMQSVAPPGGVVVGELTWRSVRDHFETEELEPFTAKGKAEPIRVWRVLGGREVVAPTTALVGRARELALLRDTVVRATDERCAQLVTIVAEPGIGKSRLVFELKRGLADDVLWLQSACAPYGDANAFSSLTEIVRGLAGVRGGDDPDSVDAALATLVHDAESAETERAWIADRLAVLAGVGDGAAERQIPVAEVAAAAARVLAATAAKRPVVVVIEDLHWAEPVLRDVVSAIVDDADAPLVVLCTARPELFDADASWGGGRTNSTTIRLNPLSEDETAALVETLLTTAIRSDTERTKVLQNIGGNPLFAIEYVRMLTDKLEAVVEAEMPASVQAVIGARLDSVVPEIRAVLQDAAVVGARFWPDALAAIADGGATDVRSGLAELTRRGLIVRSTTSWFPEQPEYGFSHALVREVAYARLPRMARARRHAAAGAWLETTAGEGAEGFADALAHHFEQAVVLADASGERPEADRWRRQASTWLLTAGKIALRVDPAGALARFERALAVTDEDDPIYAQALAQSALAGRRSGLLDREEVLRRHQRTVELHVSRGDRVAEARARAAMGGQLMALARREEATAELATAAELLANQPDAAAELALVHAWMAEDHMFAGNPGPAAELADRALASGAAVDMVAIMALHIRGDSRIALGDPDGLDDLYEALERSQTLGSVSEIVTSFNYIADREWQVDGPAVALARLDEGSELADRRGAFSQGSWTKVSALELLLELGRWDELLERAEPLAAETRMDESLLVAVDIWTTSVRIRRAEDVGDLEELLARARDVEELQVLAPALALAAEAAQRRGDVERARQRVRDFEEATAGRTVMYRSESAPAVVRVAVSVDATDVARDIVERSEPATMRDELFIDTAAAALRESEGVREPDVWTALEKRWRTYGNAFEEAEAALAFGRAADDAAATARGRALLDDLGVPPSAA